MKLSDVTPDAVATTLNSIPVGLSDDEVKCALVDIYRRIAKLNRDMDITAGTLLRIEKALARLKA